MESLSEVPWDLVISGTGLPQSLLALSLSRSGKKILHLDRNNFYGGDDAAFGLREAEQWVKETGDGDSNSGITSAKIRPASHSAGSEATPKLGSSRSYTLSLSPQLIYSQSALLPFLVSSRIHNQLEFQAIGSWWMCGKDSTVSSSFGTVEAPMSMSIEKPSPYSLQRIPGNREDVFADDTLSSRDKRALMRFLRHVIQDRPSDGESVNPSIDESLASNLSSTFKLPSYLHQPLLALSLSQTSAASTTAQHAISRIRRHMRSIGVFGPGFGAVIPKYGGGAEIAQVGCRAGAVGGAVYVLGRGISEITKPPSELGEDKERETTQIKVRLSDGEDIETQYLIGGTADVPKLATDSSIFETSGGFVQATHCISIISSALPHLFPSLSDNGPMPAGAVVVFGAENSTTTGTDVDEQNHSADGLPIYLIVHSSETGECPSGQCVIYGSIASAGEDAETQLTSALERLLHTSETHTQGSVLWSLSYVSTSLPTSFEFMAPFAQDKSGQVMTFPPPRLDLAFDDSVLDSVRAMWKKVMGAEVEEQEFMMFEDREGVGDESE